MRPRTIAIGDVHGCSLALEALLAAIGPRPDDVIVTLGDYVNRGPDSRGVIDRLIELERQCTLVPILGNHDQMFLAALAGERRGVFGPAGHGGRSDAHVLRRPADHRGRPGAHPAAHRAFLGAAAITTRPIPTSSSTRSTTRTWRWTSNPRLWLRWESLRDGIPDPHVSGKRAIVGHSSQKSGEILDLGHLVCIDTFCYGGGWLTALDVDTDEVWQVNRQGESRRTGGR